MAGNDYDDNNNDGGRRRIAAVAALATAVLVLFAMAAATAVASFSYSHSFAAAQPGYELQAARRFLPSIQVVPEAGNYVAYDVTLAAKTPITATTVAAAAGNGTLLWVHFASADGRSKSEHSFSVPAPAPGQRSVQLHTGPFKMSAGRHTLEVGVEPGVPLYRDSFEAYPPGTGLAAVAGAGLAAAGAALLAWYFYSSAKNRRQQ